MLKDTAAWPAAVAALCARRLTDLIISSKLRRVNRRAIIATLATTVCAGLSVACDYVRTMKSVCESELKPTEVRVTTTPVGYSTDLTVSEEELTRMTPHEPGRIVHGLTRTNMRSLVTIGSNGITHPITKKHCLRPVIDVALSFDPITVYVSREQTEGTCRFAMTMQHELQHVAVYREFLDTAAVDIERQLRAHFDNRIFYYDTAAEAMKQMSDETSLRIGPMVEESMKRVNEMQAPLDTPEEYDRLERSCSGL
jgi:hypothetical protein